MRGLGVPHSHFPPDGSAPCGAAAAFALGNLLTLGFANLSVVSADKSDIVPVSALPRGPLSLT